MQFPPYLYGGVYPLLLGNLLLISTLELTTRSYVISTYLNGGVYPLLICNFHLISVVESNTYLLVVSTLSEWWSLPLPHNIHLSPWRSLPLSLSRRQFPSHSYSGVCHPHIDNINFSTMQIQSSLIVGIVNFL